MVIVVMGVSGSGKSTLARALAEAWNWDFQEGDELHPPANIDKMRAGLALDDDDRRPWLERVAAWIAAELARGRDGVVTCSALKRRYRDRLRRAGAGVRFVCIELPPAELERRLRRRRHFMPASLLDSQLRTLEVPDAAENVLVMAGEDATEDIVAAVGRWLEQDDAAG
ncbi:gluconokinase [Rhodanobacter soli]|uniref:Gluconokinase n=1 Tax=Rhodanobacter soli TaxID=590609 RepID=A0ABV2PWK5_9GAMM